MHLIEENLYRGIFRDKLLVFLALLRFKIYREITRSQRPIRLKFFTEDIF